MHGSQCLTPGCRYVFDTIGAICECRAGHRHAYDVVFEAWRMTSGRQNGNGKATSALVLPSPRTETPKLLSGRLRTVQDLLNMKPPEWIINGYLPERASVILFGPTGSTKSFEALEMACCVASGFDWHGIAPVRRGTVVYIATEGQGGIGKRLRAWMAAHPGADLTKLRFILEPVNLMSRVEVDTLIATLGGLPEPPALVIHDTLARSMAGGDENSTRDATVVMGHVGLVMERFGATVMLVHHSGHAAERERGSSVFRQAADVSISLKHEDSVTTIRPEKTKDGEFFEPVRVRLQTVEGTDSCVLVLHGESESSPAPTLRQLAVLALLNSHFLDDGASASAWFKVSGLSEATFYRYRTDLKRAGLVTMANRRYTLTDEGRSTLTLTKLSSGSHESRQELLSHSHPLLRGESVRVPSDDDILEDELPWPEAGASDGIPEVFR